MTHVLAIGKPPLTVQFLFHLNTSTDRKHLIFFLARVLSNTNGQKKSQPMACEVFDSNKCLIFPQIYYTLHILMKLFTSDWCSVFK